MLMKKMEVNCQYVIRSLGKGLPLCIYREWADKRLATVKLNELKLCCGVNKCLLKDRSSTK